MPDHMHLLIELDDSKTLSASMARINSCVAKAANQALDRLGPIWQGLILIEAYAGMRILISRSAIY